MARVAWDQRLLEADVLAWKRRALNAAGRHLETAIQGLIAIQGVPVDRRSISPEPPRMESRDLIKSWTYTVNAPAGYAVVYSDLDYSYYLEIGANATFGRIDARPYVSRALIAEFATLYLLMTPPIS